MSTDMRAVYAALRAFRPSWDVGIGVPSEPGWLAGELFCTVESGPLADLLARIATRLGSQDRKVVGAAFGLRFGWASAAAIAPYVLHDAVPDVSLDNVSLRFGTHTLFERVAIHTPRGVSLDDLDQDRVALLERLRSVLVAQAEPVVEALSQWSGRSRRATWGQITSSWGAQFSSILAELGRHEEAVPAALRFFAGKGPAFLAAPTLYPVTHCDTTRVYQRRASCCLYYKTPGGGYCASCPLLPVEERLARNRTWLEKSLKR